MPGIPTVFLDRDGVINRSVVRNGKPYPPASVDELEIIPGTVNSLRRLADAGYLLLGVTNQPDVARGGQTREAVEAINARIVAALPIREIFTCYHDNRDDCPCRKPKPGLILRGAEKYRSDMSRSWMVGDRWKDVSAGKAAGLRTVFVNYNYDEIYNGIPADFTIEDMTALAGIILRS
jgi:D-glycero-D-manno-heptose 1,7-bisphosphate phosphatase